MEYAFTFVRGDRYPWFQETVRQEELVAAQEFIDIAKSTIISNSPVDLGTFVESITGEIIEDSTGTSGSVYSTDDEIKVAVIEGGRQPGTYPPVDVITEWALRHGIPPFLAGRAIFLNGIAPLRPFGKTQDQIQPQIDDINARLMSRIAERL
jgi:hypothetical protein